MNRRNLCWCGMALAAFMVGCGEDVPPQELARLREITPAPKQEEKKPEDPFAAQVNAVQPTEENPFGSTTPSAAPAAPAPGYGATQQPDNTYGQGAPIKLKSEVDNPDLAKAEGGVGKRGQGYGGGIITEPIRQKFIIQDRITFINMQNTLKFYRAEHKDKNPPTIQEFVDKIVTESGMKLPELPPGQFYVYDPTAKDLDEVLLVDQSQK